MTHEEYVEYLEEKLDEVELYDLVESTAYMRAGVKLLTTHKELADAFLLVSERVGATEAQLQEMQLRGQIVDECVELIDQLFDEHAEKVRKSLFCKGALRGDMHGRKKKS